MCADAAAITLSAVVICWPWYSVTRLDDIDLCVRGAGDTVHTILTSSGDGYQNFQTRIM